MDRSAAAPRQHGLPAQDHVGYPAARMTAGLRHNSMGCAAAAPRRHRLPAAGGDAGDAMA